MPSRSRRKWVYDWPRPAVTADLALFALAGAPRKLQVLLIQRGGEPFKGRWALPGGFVEKDEDLQAAARRELAEETGVREVLLEQVAAVGTPGRDPRGHTITILFAALVPADKLRLSAGDDAHAVRWFEVASPPPLAFDHAQLLRLALEHLRRRACETPVVFQSLPPTFTLAELQAAFEALLGRPLDGPRFRRRLKQLGLVARARGSRSEQPYRFVPHSFSRDPAGIEAALFLPSA